MAMTETERAALTQIRNTAADLEQWRLRARRLEEPEPGSDLALDDKIFERMAISQLARTSLATAGEHLRLALDAIKAQQLYPSSHFTVLRGALVGASQAVWVLESPDRNVRRERGLTVYAEMYVQLEKYYKFLGTTQLEVDDRERLDDQKLWVKERQGDVALLRTSKAKLNSTDVIVAAADYAFEDPTLRAVVRRLWHETSADAHALGWSLFQRSTFGSADRRTGIGEGVAPGSLEHVAEPFLASYRLLKVGWSLFDQRCEAP